MSAWWIAVESGWRAGLKQYRRMRTINRMTRERQALTDSSTEAF